VARLRLATRCRPDLRSAGSAAPTFVGALGSTASFRTRPPPGLYAAPGRFRPGPAYRLVTLRRRFERFREQSAPRTRVPQTLRQAVLEAVDQGVSMQALRRELGVTDKQVQSWRRRARTAATTVAGRPSEARVFEVIDPVLSAEPTEALELRLGGWSLVIRPIGRG